MASVIYCDNVDAHQGEDPQPIGNWLVSRQDAGETLAWCDACYVELARALIAQVDSVAEPEAPRAAETAPEDADDEDDADALARLEGVAAPAQGDQGPATEQAGGAPPPDAVPPDAPAPSPRVVRRGTSASRRAHEGRKRAKAAKLAGEDMVE